MSIVGRDAGGYLDQPEPVLVDCENCGEEFAPDDGECTNCGAPAPAEFDAEDEAYERAEARASEDDRL